MGEEGYDLAVGYVAGDPFIQSRGQLVNRFPVEVDPEAADYSFQVGNQHFSVVFQVTTPKLPPSSR